MSGEFPLPWCPAYEFADREVSIRFSKVSTFISDRQVGLEVCAETLERPACFWVDADHVYLRANWREWFPVSTCNPAHISLLMSVRYCRVMSLCGGEMKDVLATVHHVESLPRLFKEELEMPPCLQSNPGPANQDEFDLVSKAAEETSLQAFSRVRLGEYMVDASVSNDDTALLLRTVPRDVKTLSPEEIRRSFDVLCNARRALSKLDANAMVKIGFVAPSEVLWDVANAVPGDGEDGSDVHLIDYDGLADRLRELIPQETTEESDDED